MTGSELCALLSVIGIVGGLWAAAQACLGRWMRREQYAPLWSAEQPAVTITGVVRRPVLYDQMEEQQ